MVVSTNGHYYPGFVEQEQLRMYTFGGIDEKLL